MTAERDVLKFRCGGPLNTEPGAPMFNDLAGSRDRALADRVGLLRAVELVRAIGGSKGCVRPPDLVIDNLDDLADSTDRWIVALLLEHSRSRLWVGGWHITVTVFRRHEHVGTVLRMFAEIAGPARLKRPDMSDDWRQAAAHYLCTELGLTGEHAAWAMNLVTSPGRFNDKSVRYYATKSKQIKGGTDYVRGMLESTPLSVDSVDGSQFRALLGSSITLRLPEKLPPDVDRTLFHYAALMYNELQPGSLEIPASWPTPSLRTVPKQMIEQAMRVIVPVRRRAYATRPWPPADPRRARTFATKLAKRGRSTHDIAAALNEEGYRVSRQGGWHYRSVTRLLEQAPTDNRRGGSQ